MGPFGSAGSFYSETNPPQEQQPETPIDPASVENPPYQRYADSGAESFAPSTVADPTFQPSTEVQPVAAGPTFSIPLMILGAGFLLWILSKGTEYE